MQRPVSDLEVARFTTKVFDALGVTTVGELVAVTQLRFLTAAERLAAALPDAPSRSAGMSLGEVRTILANLGLDLKPHLPFGSYDALYARLREAAAEAGIEARDTEMFGKPALALLGAPGRFVVGPNFSEDDVSFQHIVDRAHAETEAFIDAALALYRRVVGAEASG